jgi:MraZ protein
MLTRKTQYGWMALGGLICLFGLVLACKLRDGNKAVAQVDKSVPEVPVKEDKSPLLEPPSPSEKKGATDFTISSSVTPKIRSWKSESGKASAPAEPKKATAEPAPMLGMSPLADAPPRKEHPPTGVPLDAAPGILKTSPPPSPSSPVLPVSFSPNAPTPPSDYQPAKSPRAMSESPAKPSVVDAPPPPPPMPSFTPPPAAVKGTTSGLTTPANPPKPPMITAPPPPAETKVSPTLFAPVSPAAPSFTPGPEHEARSQPGEPPLAPAPGPVQIYHVHGSETLQDIARRTLGSAERWPDLHKLNPTLKTDAPLSSGTAVRLPGDACVQTDDSEPVKPLPTLRAKAPPAKTKVLPLTGTFLCNLDEKGQLTLPRALRDQLAGTETVLVSPGPDKCLWLTNHPHLERLADRLEQSRANEADVRVFKRLYFAQTEKLSVNGEGRVQIPERLAQFAGLHQELVLVGIDDHFEVWDAARWRQYTRQKSAAASRSTSATDSE